MTKQRAVVNKWKFQDSMMGEQYIMFNITSETPIAWAIGDYCVFRGETFTLNYVPSVTQKARIKERQDSFTYENVKFESQQEELTRCIMLDITPTTGDYIAALGTNYTGSSRFNLFCGETTANGSTLTAVCALAAKIQANLDRMFPTNGWKILVDTKTTYIDGSGIPVLVTHTDDKMLSFDNTTVAQALAEVHNTFDLDYCVRGRTIYIGYNLKNLTSDNDDETFAFGYGKGYPTRDDSGKALFQIKRIANSQQKVVTRLRALGSTKNMPYRYYNNKYNLSQSLFPTNLQLPDTFIPEGSKSDSAGTNSKWGHNKQRASYLRAVKGDTNDAYIDKNDDAASCVEGIREESARWDGTNGDLPEIYPTIEEATYGELRSALVQDQDGRTGQNSFPNYGSTERIDSMLAIGYLSDGTLVDDANKGDGILPESGTTGSGIPRSATIGQTTLNYNKRDNGDFTSRGSFYAGVERTLFTIQDVFAGKYAMAPTIGAVIYGFSLSCYKDGISAEVGFQIAIKQKSKNTGTTTTIATYTSDFVSIARADGIKEMELPEIPDVKNGSGAKVSSVTVTELSDITVTFTPIMRNITVPSGFTDNFGLVYKVGNSRLDNTVTYAPEYTWISADGEGNSEETFHVFIKDMGFDITACWTDETPVVAMKSGRCVGREFEIGENVQKVTYNGKQGYMLTLKRATDSSLNTYYPSANDPIAAGDYFVLLNISMPDVYVKMAEVRLLKAATDYLADNCETAFTYQPYIDDIFLQRNYDNMEAAGTPEKSIFWRLYAGLKFTFRGIPTNEEDPLPLADITIAQVSISMGEGLTPKVEITLNDDVQQSTLQKLTTSVDRIYNGSLFSSGSGGAAGTGANSAALMSILQSEGAKQFLSKKNDDTAEGKITFNDVVTHKEALKARKGIKVGEFQSRLLGSGAIIDEEGNAEFESIYSRNFISTPEFRFNRISVTEGEQWCTNGFGTILAVDVIDDTTGYITLKLEENDYASIAEGDICRGIYNDIASRYETATLDDDSELYGTDESSEEENPKEGTGFGFSCKDGFFTSYFWVKQMVSNKRGECKFLYELRNTKTPHPCEFMKFAQYGSFTNSERRSSSYATSIGHYYEIVLDGVSTWKIRSANVVYRKGYLGNMTVTLKNGKDAQLQGYGLYVQDNVYFGNAIVSLDPETIKDIEDVLRNYNVSFSDYVDVVTVDDVGNVIGGLWEQNGTYKRYRIQSAITVRNNDINLLVADDDKDASAGTYKIYAHPKGCTCKVEDSTLYITGIDNIKDGVAGSADDVNFDYDAMRKMDSCYVDIIVDCEGKGSIQKRFPIRIKHDSQPFVGADLTNVFSEVTWNTKTQSYIGLPIEFDFKMWHNNEFLSIESVNDISVTSTVTGVAISKSVVTITENEGTEYENSYKIARIRITALPSDLPPATELNISCSATYAGISYERTLVHTISKRTETNVYSLLPSVSEVIYNKNTKSLNVSTVNSSVVCDSSEDQHYTVAYADFAKHDLVMYYRKYYKDGTSDESETLYNNTAVSINTSVEKIVFYLYGLSNGSVDRTVIHDVEDIYVVADGEDGKGVEYIFFQQNSDTPRPTIRDDSSDTTIDSGQSKSRKELFQEDDYCPYNTGATQQWTDEPVGVGENSMFEFYAQRKKVNGVWQPFGTVKLWNRYAVDGQSPYMMDLSNEQSFVNCDESGSVIGNYETSNLMIFKGSGYAFTDFNIRITPTNVKCNGNSSAFTLTDSQKTTAQTNGYFTLTPSAISSNSAQISIQATLKTNTSIVLVAVYKINKNLAGQNGVIYSLIPSLNVIHKNADGTYRDTVLNVQVNKIVGSSVTELTTKNQLSAEGLSLFYQGSHSTEQEAATLTGLPTSTLCGTALFTKLFLRETNSETLLDSERINVVADGEDGVSYFIDAKPDSVTIPTDATGATYSGVIKFYKNVADEIIAVQWYSAIYVRKLDGTRRYIGGKHTFYGYGTDESPFTINVTTEDDVIEVFCIDEANASSLLTDYVIKKEIAIYKNGDTGPDGDDGVTYYLTSTINTIIRDSNGDYKGSARPIITAWKKVGENDAVRLNDITTPSVAEGFTIKAYEKNGDTTRYTNTSTNGILTCAVPYSDVDRFEVELIKDGKTYATMSIPIINEVKGEDGNDGAGVFPRDCGLFTQGNTYYYKKEGTMYVRDMVRYEIGGVMYGFLVKDTTVGTPGVTAAPTSASGDSNWEASGIIETVIANTLFGSNANIGGFLASAEMLRSSTPAYRVKYMGYYKSVQYGLYYQGTFTTGMTVYYQYRGYNVYGAVMYQGTLYKRKSSATPDTSKTPNNDTDHWVVASSADMACTGHQNEEILIPDGCSYTYSQATGDTPAIRPLVRDSDGKYWVAKGSMLGKTFADTSFSSSHWREAFDFEVGGISSVGDTVDVPKFMLNGATGTMIMRQADDTIYTYDEDGKQTTGYEDGRKVVIDPTTKSVSVFDDNNKQVITINGDKKSSISSAYTGDSGNTSASANSLGFSAPSTHCTVIPSAIQRITGNFTIGEGGWNLQYSGSITSRATYQTSSYWCPDQDKNTLSYIQPIVLGTNSYGHQSYCKVELVLVKEGGSTISLAMVTQGSNGNPQTKSFDTNMHIGSGTYYFAIRYTCAIYSSGNVSISWTAISASWAKGVYMGEIFANGLAFGNNAQNFFAVIKESDTNLHLKLLSNNKYGIEISSSGVKICINGTWYTLGVSGGNATLT